MHGVVDLTVAFGALFSSWYQYLGFSVLKFTFLLHKEYMSILSWNPSIIIIYSKDNGRSLTYLSPNLLFSLLVSLLTVWISFQKLSKHTHTHVHTHTHTHTHTNVYACIWHTILVHVIWIKSLFLTHKFTLLK